MEDMGELDIDSILDIDEMDSLFDQEGTQKETTPEEEQENKTTDEEDENHTLQESVGSRNNIKEKEGASTSRGNGTSPNFYSSIANALREDGIFPDLDDDDLKNTNNADTLKAAIEKQIQANLDARQQRIDKALNAGIEVSDIKKFENTINYLDNISDELLEDEGEQGETLRKNLIYQDFINRGYSKERAAKEIKKSFNAGTDIEDAKEALQSNLEHFHSLYDDEVQRAEKQQEERKKEVQASVEKLRKSVMEDEKFFGELTLEKSVRQKVYDNISKPKYKDDSGNYITPLQKYQRENPMEWVKNIGLIFTLTDGFKNLDGLTKGKVRKEVNKGLKDLEHTLNNTTRDSDGNLKFITGVDDDPESYLSGDWSIALD